MGIKNLDLGNENNEIRATLVSALKENNNEKVTEALVRMAEGIQENLINEARSMVNTELNDIAILDRRGVAQLTSEERKYYNEVIEKRGFTDLTVTLPRTVFERVFEDLLQNHPLLSKINFVNTTATTEWIIRTTECEGAWWGKLTDSIKKELEHSFDKIQTGMYKLSAYDASSKSNVRFRS